MSLDNEERVIEFIEKSSRPLIVIPRNPDGDAIGSALALFLALKKAGKSPKISCSDKISEKFSFLNGCNLIEQKAIDEFTYEMSFDVGEKGIEDSCFVSSEDNLKFHFKSKNCNLTKDSIHFEPRFFEYDSIFVLGSENLKELGAIYSNCQNIFSNLPVVNIDYHNLNENFGNVNLIDSKCISVSEIIAKVIEVSSFLEIDNEIASLLMTGIIEKTDNLQSPSSDSEIFYLTAYLLSLGAKRNEIVKYLYKENIFLKRISQIGLTFNLYNLRIKKIFSDARIDKLKLKKTSVMFLITLLMGVFLFQVAKSGYNLAQNIFVLPSQNKKFVEDVNNLELSQNLQEDSQVMPINAEEKEDSESSIILSDNNENKNIATTNNNINTTVTINSIAIEENKIREKELPVRLEIPKLGINTGVQHVGLNSKNEMDVPNNDQDVAWYNLGAEPGEMGSAVVAGHLDSRYGKPAIFWNLKNLAKGDVIYIFDGNGRKLKFEVMYAERYSSGQAPMEKIFGADDGIYLNLITCNGTWNRNEGNYDERLVVYTKLVS